MAWSDYDNAIDAGIGAGVRFNAATGPTGRYYQAQYDNSVGDGYVPVGYISWEPHANRSNEGAFVRHDANGNVTDVTNFAPREKTFRNALLAAAGVAGFGFGGAALLGSGGVGGATGAATGAASGGGSGAFLGEGVVSGVGSWDAAYAAATQGATSTAASIGSTVKSALSGAQTYLKPVMSLASALTGGATAGEPQPAYVPFDQTGAGGINPLVWLALAGGVLFLLMDR